MSDLISRHKVLIALHESGLCYNNWLDVRSEINAIPSADRPTGEWIPVSDGLPKEKQEIYVTVYFTEGDTGRAYGYIDGFGKWHLYSTVEGTLNSGYEVTAWMPLPEPYKGGDTE